MGSEKSDISNQPPGLKSSKNVAVRSLAIVAAIVLISIISYVVGRTSGSLSPDPKSVLLEAVRANQAAKVEQLLDSGIVVDVQIPTDEGLTWTTPLHEAAKYGAVDVLALLVRRGASVNILDFGGYSPVQVIGFRDDNPKAEECVRILAEGGADLDIQHPTSRQTALHMASRFGNVKWVIGLLENGAKVEIRDAGGNTALHEAFHYRIGPNPAVVKALISAGADVNTKNDAGKIPKETSQ